FESNESNNNCSNTVTVTAPDLTITKANNVGGSVLLGNSWTWTLTGINGGNSSAAFANGDVILRDVLPTGPGYGSPAVTPGAGVTGTISCSISVVTLTCSASGPVTIASGVGGSFTVQVLATPTAAGTFTNPDGVCAIDPDSHVTE